MAIQLGLCDFAASASRRVGVRNVEVDGSSPLTSHEGTPRSSSTPVPDPRLEQALRTSSWSQRHWGPLARTTGFVDAVTLGHLKMGLVKWSARRSGHW